jgi:hypothetical protein
MSDPTFPILCLIGIMLVTGLLVGYAVFGVGITAFEQAKRLPASVLVVLGIGLLVAVAMVS